MHEIIKNILAVIGLIAVGATIIGLIVEVRRERK